jgi:hypothetical protein
LSIVKTSNNLTALSNAAVDVAVVNIDGKIDVQLSLTNPQTLYQNGVLTLNPTS